MAETNFRNVMHELQMEKVKLIFLNLRFLTNLFRYGIVKSNPCTHARKLLYKQQKILFGNLCVQ